VKCFRAPKSLYRENTFPYCKGSIICELALIKGREDDRSNYESLYFVRPIMLLFWHTKPLTVYENKKTQFKIFPLEASSILIQEERIGLKSPYFNVDKFISRDALKVAAKMLERCCVIVFPRSLSPVYAVSAIKAMT